MKTDLLEGFLPYQKEWLADGSRFKLGLWARQTGKDFTCAAEAVIDCVRRAKSHWLILACGERQAKESLEKAREFARSLEERALLITNSELRITNFQEARQEPRATVSAETRQERRAGTDAPYLGRRATILEARQEPRATQNTRTEPRATGGRTPHVVPYNLVKRESATELRFVNGSRITALPAKAGTIRGYSANLILTEFAFHDDPEGIWRAIFPSVSNGLRGGAKKLRIISTPNGQGNCFHELWTGSKIFSRHKVTMEEAVAQGLPVDMGALREGLLDAEAWAQEYECEFADSSSVLLPYELIEGCEVAEATETSPVDALSRSFSAQVPHAPELFVGIDFGRKQDLTVCWIFEKVPTGVQIAECKSQNGTAAAANHLGRNGSSWITREVLVLKRMPTPAQIEALRPRVRLARKVCVDYTGAGVGLGDALVQEFGSHKVELCTFTAPFKEEIFIKLRAAFERRSIFIPKTNDIREDLHSLHRVVSHSGQISFRASRTADGHSDRCTALALAVRAAESAPARCGVSVIRPRRERTVFTPRMFF